MKLSEAKKLARNYSAHIGCMEDEADFESDFILGKAKGFLEGWNQAAAHADILIQGLEAIIKANKSEGAENLTSETSDGNYDDVFRDGRTKGENYVASKIEEVVSEYKSKMGL